MTFEIRISDQAKQDLENIYGYIAYDLQIPQIAAELMQRLEKAIMGLDEMPERHRLYEKEPWHSRGLRVMPTENYIVYYIPDVKCQTVSVVRVMYGGRDTDAQLKHTK